MRSVLSKPDDEVDMSFIDRLVIGILICIPSLWYAYYMYDYPKYRLRTRLLLVILFVIGAIEGLVFIFKG
jgi:hypothetical protein